MPCDDITTAHRSITPVILRCEACDAQRRTKRLEVMSGRDAAGPSPFEGRDKAATRRVTGINCARGKIGLSAQPATVHQTRHILIQVAFLSENGIAAITRSW